ncbi:MAG TPA: hypothetical protein VJX67_00895 [Blastocatellia bacterium]|nr:hypothetical protein [Blastocatellia bacterium]
MKNKIEPIRSSLFRQLNEGEQLGSVAGGTSGPTYVITGPVANHPDILADFREDPPV